MAQPPQHLLRMLTLGGASIVAAVLVPRIFADPPATQAPVQGTTLLQQLSDQTQQLYRQSRHSIVRVQLPTPPWLAQYNQRQLLLQKWGAQLNPDVREKLMEMQDRALQQSPTTGPATQPASLLTIPATQPSRPGLQVTDAPNAIEVSVSLFAIGMLVDDQGHAVFPVYVDRKYLGKDPLPAVTGEGQATTATFVGSDSKTNLTVLQLADHTGTPVVLASARPDDGALTLVIATDGAARLLVWNSQHPEPGFAILADGSVGGFGFGTHFLGASTAKPIVDQLIATGEVHRAILGVLIQEVDRDNILRRQRPELGSSPAIRIVAVQDKSAAAQGGIKPDDLVLAIGDQPVGDAPTFAAVIATRSGETSLKVLRGSKTIELTVNLQPN